MATVTLKTDTLATMKTNVIRRIKQINDEETMTQLVDRLNEVAPEYPSFFTPELIALLDADIEQGRKDIAEGHYFDHEEVMAEMDQWLAEKN
ncbi:MAG: hypothetical protein LBQ50_08365 [Planctomycetaceae bacterium]|nr:hypothetical protein [Planctomycetaceae bacterium]